MSWLAGPYLAAAALLVLAGAPKVRHPDSAVRALASLGWPAAAAAVRVLGGLEVLVGLGAIVLAGPVPALLVAGSYAAFSGFVALARRRGGVLSSCGCFGTADTPPTRTHLAVTLGLAGVALTVAAQPLGTPWEAVASTPGSGLPLLGFAAVTVWLGYLVLAVAPRSGGRAIAGASAARRA